MIKKSYEEKYIIMESYHRTIGKAIDSETVYEGYPIGTWQRNIRLLDRKGGLCIPDTLRKAFSEIGVICPRQRKEKVSTTHKIETLIEFRKKFPNEEINGKTVNENGEPIGEYRYDLQIAYSTGKIRLGEKLIEELKGLRILNKTGEEIQALAEKYHIQTSQIRRIEKEYGDTEKFISSYIAGDISLSIDEMETLGIKEFNLFTLSSRNLTVSQKSAIIKCILDVQGVKSSERLNFKGKFIDIDYVDELIKSLSVQDRNVIELYYGLNGKTVHSKRAMDRELDIGRVQINSRLRKIKAYLKIKYPSLKTIRSIRMEQNRLLAKFNEDKENARRELDKLKDANEQKMKDEYDRLTKRYNEGISDDTPIEKCTFLSIRAIHALIRIGITTVGEARKLTLEDVSRIYGVGEKTFSEIVSKLELKLKVKMVFVQGLIKKLELYKKELQDRIDGVSDKQKEIRDRLDNIENLLYEYDLAGIRTVNIFDGEDPIKATATPHIKVFNYDIDNSQSCERLKKKRKRRESKKRKLVNIQEAIEKQSNKQKMLEGVLGQKGIEDVKEKGDYC